MDMLRAGAIMKAHSRIAVARSLKLLFLIFVLNSKLQIMISRSYLKYLTIVLSNITEDINLSISKGFKYIS